MPRRSTATLRDAPVEKTIAAAGTFVVHGECFSVETTERIQLMDLTDKVMSYARQSGVREGTFTLWSMHTTCALFINEAQRALLADMRRFLEEIVAPDRYYMHNDSQHSDCDRMNADAHLRAMLLAPSLTLQISGGELVLGQWQRVLMAELDGPRPRTLRAQVMGLAS